MPRRERTGTVHIMLTQQTQVPTFTWETQGAQQLHTTMKHLTSETVRLKSKSHRRVSSCSNISKGNASFATVVTLKTSSSDRRTSCTSYSNSKSSSIFLPLVLSDIQQQYTAVSPSGTTACRVTIYGAINYTLYLKARLRHVSFLKQHLSVYSRSSTAHTSPYPMK